MYLTGLTLAVQGMVAVSEAPSSVILEIQSSSRGLSEKLKELLNDGPPRILDTRWIGTKSFLHLLPENLGREYLETSSYAVHVALYEAAVARAQEEERQNRKNGVTR